MLEKKIDCGKWDRWFNCDDRWNFIINTDKYIIQITGGSIIIQNKSNGKEIGRLKGYNYLYTGDVKPDETELFALENGKHFYIISLKDYTQKMRITLPRSYEAIDVYGNYSNDGKSLFVPVYKYADNEFKFFLCEYETESYSLIEIKRVKKSEINHW